MVIFHDLLLNLAVGNFRGAFVGEPGACHDDISEVTYFFEFPSVALFLDSYVTLVSLWAMALAAWSTNCSCLSGE